MSERRAYQLLDAAEIRTQLTTEPGFSTDQMTERQARELKVLPSEQRVEVARAVDFAEVSVRDLKRIIRERKETARVERKIECETPPPDLLASTRAVAFARRGSGRAPYRRLTYRAGVWILPLTRARRLRCGLALAGRRIGRTRKGPASSPGLDLLDQ